MKLDVDTLETFYEMAREGAGLAADRLAPMAGVQTRVSVTRLHFTTWSAIANELDDGRRKLLVRVDLTGGIDGRSLILFDEGSASEISRALVTEVDAGDDLAESAITEVGGIMNNGFVDGWADVLGTEIDVSTPELVVGTEPAAFLDGASGEELVVAFRSRIETVGEEMTFQHYLVPDHDVVERLFEGRSGGRVVDSEKLAGFDRMTEEGTNRVAENLAMMSDLDADVEVRRIDFVSLDAIPESVPNERLVSVAFTFEGTPSGYLLFLFDRASASSLVEATLGTEPEGDLGAMERDAIQELSNVMASGLLDGWANVLDTAIDHSTPAYTYDMGAAVVDPLVVGLAQRQEFAFVFDTRIRAVDTTFNLEIYAIPDEDELLGALDALDPGRIGEAPVAAEFAAEGAKPGSFDVDGLTEVDSP